MCVLNKCFDLTFFIKYYKFLRFIINECNNIYFTKSFSERKVYKIAIITHVLSNNHSHLIFFTILKKSNNAISSLLEIFSYFAINRRII